MFTVMRHRVAVATALGCAATLLVSCSGVESSGDKDGNVDASTSTAPVSVNPAAPELIERISAYNFIHTDGDGSMKTLATIQVMSSKGWMDLSDEKNQFTVLEGDKYTVRAHGASGCSGIGSPAAEELGAIGEMRVDSKRNADAWDVSSKMDEGSFTTVVLVDSDSDPASCAKAVAWTEPTEENDF